VTRFTVRVELHRADEQDYEALHDEMYLRGFGRTIISSAGLEFSLPTAEYNEISSRTPQEVRADARAAISAIGKKGAVLVTPSERGRWWSGLDEVEDTDEE